MKTSVAATLLLSLLLGWWVPRALADSFTGYNTVEDEGTPVTPRRTKLNFIGASVSCADDATNFETDCTFSGAAGSGDITSVGDVASGAAFDGTQGTTLTFNNAGGDATLDYDGSDFNFSVDLTLSDATPALTLNDSSGDDFELWVDDSQGYFSNLTDAVVIWRATQGNALALPSLASGTVGCVQHDANGVLQDTGAACGAGAGMTSFTLAGDSGSSQTISDGNTLTAAGGTNGIDTVAGATDTITLNFDSTEVGTTTWGSGAGITWTFDAGATDPVLTFSSALTAMTGSIFRIGSTAIASTDPALVVTRSVTGSGNAHAFVDESSVNKSGTIGFNSFDADATITGSNNYDHVAAFQSRPNYDSNGTISKYYNFVALPEQNGGAMTDLYGLYVADAIGTGTITTQTGVYIPTQTKGSTNYAITVGSSDVDHNLLHVGVTGDPLLKWIEASDWFTFTNDLDIADATPALTFTDSSGDAFEISTDDSQFYISNLTDSVFAFRINQANVPGFPGFPNCNLDTDGNGNLVCGTDATTGGGGDVVGPASSTDNAIARYDGTTGKLLQNSGIVVDDNAHLGIGTTAPAFSLDVREDGVSFDPNIQLRAANNSTPEIRLYSHGGTLASPSVSAAGDNLGVINFDGFGTAEDTGAVIYALVEGTPGAGGVAGSLYFATAPLSSSYLTRLELESDGTAVWNDGTDASQTQEWTLSGACDPFYSVSNKTFTWGCTGGSNNETLTADFDTTANTITFGSGTGVTDWSSSADLNISKSNANLTLTHTGGDTFHLGTEAGSILLLSNATDGVPYLQINSTHDMLYGSTSTRFQQFDTDGTGDGEIRLPADSIGEGELDINNTGTTGQVLSLASTGRLTWSSAGAGTGDVEAVGDCTTGACFTGASGTSLTPSGGTLTVNGDLTLADATGALLWDDTSGDDFEAYVDDSQWYLTNFTDATPVLRVNQSNQVGLPVLGECPSGLITNANGNVVCKANQGYVLPLYSAKLTGAYVTASTISGLDTATQGAQIDAGDGNWRLLFDPTTDESAVWMWVLPPSWKAHGSLVVNFSMASGTSNEVEFEAAVMCVTPNGGGDIGTASFAAGATTTTTVPGAAGNVTQAAITLTDDGCKSGDIIYFYLSTDADDATNDDATGDREVVSLEYQYAG